MNTQPLMAPAAVVGSYRKWLLQAHLNHIKNVLGAGFRDFGGYLGDDVYRGIGRNLQDAALALRNSDRLTARLLEESGAHAVTRSPSTALPDNPGQLHTLWSDLSRQEKDVLYRTDPFLGNRNGIPHVDRDYYNRQTLARLQARAAELSDADAAKKYVRIARALESRPGMPPRYLALIDARFRVAIASRDPDSAPNVVTYVAPAGTNPITGGARLDKLRQSALAVDPDSDPSIIAWSGYEGAPSVSRSIEAVHAQSGAPLLRGYQEGLRVTHEGSPARHTVLGYSYGSVTAGHAAAHAPLEADNVVFLGSFGVGVDHATDLKLAGVDPGDIERHVFSTVAEHDWIRLMPKTHGEPPAGPGFGGITFTTDSDRGPWTSLGWNPHDHHRYWDTSNQAMVNIGRIITGHGHLVT
ncbi:alpha/beta hydrolase [Nocardia carnea]|uniref:alpha/beta hydrolase n=1 Tax=Nocardia carnea TaxID=37328 RepID=UPI00245625B7|nr:alpha/beta hydrolase [Nocardia carnea]